MDKTETTDNGTSKATTPKVEAFKEAFKIDWQVEADKAASAQKERRAVEAAEAKVETDKSSARLNAARAEELEIRAKIMIFALEAVAPYKSVTAAHAEAFAAEIKAKSAAACAVSAAKAEIAHRISTLPLGGADDIARMLAMLSALEGRSLPIARNVKVEANK